MSGVDAVFDGVVKYGDDVKRIRKHVQACGFIVVKKGYFYNGTGKHIGEATMYSLKCQILQALRGCKTGNSSVDSRAKAHLAKRNPALPPVKFVKMPVGADCTLPQLVQRAKQEAEKAKQTALTLERFTPFVGIGERVSEKIRQLRDLTTGMTEEAWEGILACCEVA